MTFGSHRDSDILLCEDNPQLASDIDRALRSRQLRTKTVFDETAWRSAVESRRHAVIILDRLLSGKDTLPALDQLRRSGDRTPLIFLSEKSTPEDAIRCLKAGCDDYLGKPFAMDELLARVEALGRRATAFPETKLVVADLTMDLIDRTVHRGARPINLNTREFAVLQFFMRRPNQPISREMLLEAIWVTRRPIKPSVVDVAMSNLRRRIAATGGRALLTTCRGIGYVLNSDSQHSADSGAEQAS